VIVVIVDLHTILDAKSCVVTGEPRFWGDVGDNGKEELSWELENCGDGMRYINFRSEEAI